MNGDNTNYLAKFTVVAAFGGGVRLKVVGTATTTNGCH